MKCNLWGWACVSYISFRFNIIPIIVILCTFVGRTISFRTFIAAISGRRTWWTVIFVPAVGAIREILKIWFLVDVYGIMVRMGQHQPRLWWCTFRLRCIGFCWGRGRCAAGRPTSVHWTGILGAALWTVTKYTLSSFLIEWTAYMPFSGRIEREWTIHLRQIWCKTAQTWAARIHQWITFLFQTVQRRIGRRRCSGRIISLVSSVDIQLRIMRLRLRCSQSSMFRR